MPSTCRPPVPRSSDGLFAPLFLVERRLDEIDAAALSKSMGSAA